MSESAPDWLALHGATISLAPDKNTRVVRLGDAPQYLIVPTPAEGKHMCKVVQGVNGKRLDKGEIYSSDADALRGGLEVLRLKLGW